MSIDPGFDDTEVDGERDDTEVEHNGVHKANGERFLFPAAYTFRTDGPTLQVVDGNGRIAMIFAEGAWEFAVSAGATFTWEWESGDSRLRGE